jgi:hypothetical protein
MVPGTMSDEHALFSRRGAGSRDASLHGLHDTVPCPAHSNCASQRAYITKQSRPQLIALDCHTYCA